MESVGIFRPLFGTPVCWDAFYGVVKIRITKLDSRVNDFLRWVIQPTNRYYTINDLRPRRIFFSPGG